MESVLRSSEIKVEGSFCCSVLLVGIGGLSGCGKSTCAHRMVAELNSPFFPITIDDFFYVMEHERRQRTLGVSSVSDRYGWCTSLEDVRAVNWEGYVKTVEKAKILVYDYLKREVSCAEDLRNNDSEMDYENKPTGQTSGRSIPVHVMKRTEKATWRSYVEEYAPELLRYVRPFDWKSCFINQCYNAKHSSPRPYEGESGFQNLDSKPMQNSKLMDSIDHDETLGVSERDECAPVLSLDSSYANHLAYDEECKEETLYMTSIRGKRLSNMEEDVLHSKHSDEQLSITNNQLQEEGKRYTDKYDRPSHFRKSSTSQMATVYVVCEGFVLLSYPPLLRFFDFFINIDCPSEIGALRRFFRAPRQKTPITNAASNLTLVGQRKSSNATLIPLKDRDGASSLDSLVTVISPARLKYIFYRLYRERSLRHPFHRDVALQWWHNILAVVEKEELPNRTNSNSPCVQSFLAARRHVSLWLSDEFFFFPLAIPSVSSDGTHIKLEQNANLSEGNDEISEFCFCTFSSFSPEKQKELLNREDSSSVQKSPYARKCCCLAFERFWGMDQWMHAPPLNQSILALLRLFCDTDDNRERIKESNISPEVGAARIPLDALLRQLRDDAADACAVIDDKAPSPQALLWGGLESQDIPVILYMITLKVVEQYISSEISDRSSECSWDLDKLSRSVWHCLSAYAVFRFWYFYEVLYYHHLQQPIWLEDHDVGDTSSINWCEESVWRCSPFNEASLKVGGNNARESKKSTLWIKLDNGSNNLFDFPFSDEVSVNTIREIDKSLLYKKLSQLSVFIRQCGVST